MASQTITGPDLQYTQDNLHASAYSGQVACDNNPTTLIKFTSNNGYFVGSFMPFYASGTLQSRDYNWTIKFNGIIVINRVFSQSYGPAPEREIDILIPPLTDVLITAHNLTDTEAHDMAAKLVGRVYEHLPVRN